MSQLEFSQNPDRPGTIQSSQELFNSGSSRHLDQIHIGKLFTTSVKCNILPDSSTFDTSSTSTSSSSSSSASFDSDATRIQNAQVLASVSEQSSKYIKAANARLYTSYITMPPGSKSGEFDQEVDSTGPVDLIETTVRAVIQPPGSYNYSWASRTFKDRQYHNFVFYVYRSMGPERWMLVEAFPLKEESFYVLSTRGVVNKRKEELKVAGELLNLNAPTSKAWSSPDYEEDVLDGTDASFLPTGDTKRWKSCI